RPGAAEVCNDVDDSCGGGTDEGCDDDGDDYCDAAKTVVGTPAVCPNSPANTADDCNDAVAAIRPGAAEVCNNLDDNCASGVDDGCDDDADDYCDSGRTSVGTPLVCPLSPANTTDDCNDAQVSINPGAKEVCTDGIDNNCDGKLDTADTIACPPITVDIFTFADPLDVAHGQYSTLFASISPNDPGFGTPTQWSRVWTVVDAQPSASCALADVLLSNQTNAAGSTNIRATMPNVLAKKDCVYTVQVAVNGYAKDTARLRMVNRRPQLSVSGATFDGTAWRIFAIAGSTPTITVNAADADTETAIDFNWSGTDKPRLSCNPNCVFADTTAPFAHTVTWSAPATGGTYRLTASAADRFEPASPGTADIVVEVDTCVWVQAGGAGTGATPGSPLGSIQAALNQASLSAGNSACVMGSGVFPENLTLPSAPNAPDLVGGFATGTGAPAPAQLPIVEVNTATGVQFGVGYAGSIRHLTVRQAAGAPVGLVPTSIIKIQNASPQLIDTRVLVGVGTPATGIAVDDDLSVASVTTPTLSGSTIQNGAAIGADATGIRATRTTGTGPVVTLNATSINLTNMACPVLCRGVFAEGAEVRVASNSYVYLYATTGSAVGIDFAGSATNPVTGRVTGSSVQAGSANGQLTVAVRLSNSSGVAISGNSSVGGTFTSAGRAFSAGIADGMITRAGVLTRGSSSGLTISNNGTIAGGSSYWATACGTPTPVPEGADVTAGIFLAGSSDVTVSGNGRPTSSFEGVFGGASTTHWDPATRRLVPSAVGVWLVETARVSVVRNEIRAGTYQTFLACTPASENPPGIGLRDGLPPNPAFGGGVPGSLASAGLRLDGNGVSCARPRNAGAIPIGAKTWCVGVELNAPGGLSPPVLVNNYLTTAKGDVLVSLRQRGGSGVVAANNTFDADLMLELFDPPSAPNSIIKWAVLLENLAPGGISLINNIFYAHADDPDDQTSNRLLVREVTTAGTNSRIAALRNNLFYIQKDDLAVPAAQYLRVTDGVATVNYLSNQLNAVAGIGACSSNIAALPGLTEMTSDWQKSESRLIAGSAALDVGLPVGAGVPGHDIENEARPKGIGVDLGHDER
ncbi:MAG: MopE-related protein, partial [Myxococcaceae bacterium]